MTTPNPTPARDAVTAAIDAVWESRSIADRRAAINALITAARADERAQLAAARERAIEEAAALCDRALKTIPPKSVAAAEVLHLAGRIRALAGRKGKG